MSDTEEDISLIKKRIKPKRNFLYDESEKKESDEVILYDELEKKESDEVILYDESQKEDSDEVILYDESQKEDSDEVILYDESQKDTDSSKEWTDIRSSEDFEKHAESRIVLDLVDESQKRKKRVIPLKKGRKKFSDVKKSILQNYNFMKEDEEDEDIYTETSEKSYTSELDPEIRREMGLENRQIALYDALLLLEKGRLRKFLEQKISKIFFGPAYSLMESCGFGKNIKNNKDLWVLAWGDSIVVKELKTPIIGECFACGLKRKRKYSFYHKSPKNELTFLGNMGSLCYNIKFKALLNLIRVFKNSAYLINKYNIQPETNKFKKYVLNPIEKANYKVMSAPQKMKEQYNK